MSAISGRVFVTINLINNKVYIGITKTNRNYYIGSGVAFKIAVKKYGKHNFKKEILVSNINTVDKLCFLEDFYVKLYNSRDTNFGYNIRPGGNSSGWRHNEESLNKIKNRANKEDNKIRIRDIQKLAAKKRIGSHHSKESKHKAMSTKFGKNRVIEIYTKAGKLVNTCNFSPEACKLTGVGRSNISNNLCGLTNFAGDYIFKYKEI